MGISATIIAGDKKDGTGSLLFYYYGTGKLGDVNTLPSSVKTAVTSEGGIVFAPNSALNTGGDCSGTGTFGIDDFNVSDQVVACAVKNYGIDPKRIYATGCSAGGLTTGCMGIMRSNYIAAVAPNSGGVTIGYGKLQNPMHAPDAITMNGGAGDNVIVNFGNTSEGYDNYILKYGGFAVNCIHNLGHCGAPAALYDSAWQFLKAHPFGTKPSPYAAGLPSGFHSSCKIFAMTDMAPIGGY
jgi:poly(3-hydroxybutyrate) depolymerase